MKVLGIGNALCDILTNLYTDDCFKELGLIKGGMKLINDEELMKIISFIENKDSKLASGGSASNTISGLSRLGLDCGFIGKVGNDNYGNFYINDLIKNGVHPHIMETEMASGCAMCLITPDGERTMGTFLGAAATMNASELTIDMFKGYDLLHIEGYLVQDHNLILEIFKLAKKAGLKTSIDMASFNIIAADLDFFTMLVREYVDIVFANEEESYAYTHATPHAAAEIISKQCEIAVVKIGAKGSIVRRGSEVVEVKAYKSNCIDTTGAGDLHAAGFIYGLSQERSLKECAEIGSVVSGNVVEVIGTKMDTERWHIIEKDIAAL